MRQVVRISGPVFLGATLLAHTVAAQPLPDAKGMSNQSQVPPTQEDGLRSCTLAAEGKLNDILEGLKTNRTGRGWTIEGPVSPVAETTVNNLRSTLGGCPPLRGLAGVIGAKSSGKSAIEEILNHPTVRTTVVGSKARVEFEVERAKDLAFPSPMPKGPDLIADKIDAVGVRLANLEQLVQSRSSRDFEILLLIFVATLNFLSLLGLGWLAWVMHSKSKTLEEDYQEFHQRNKGNAARLQSIEGRVGAVERQQGAGSASRGGTAVKTAVFVDGRSKGPDDSVLRAEHDARVELERQYKEVTRMVSSSMRSFEAFEALKAKFQLIPLERTSSPHHGSSAELRSASLDSGKANFWGVEVGPYTLMYPGRHLYAIASTLADMNGQGAVAMFADLFEIQWDARDLRVDDPALIESNGRGGFQVRQPGRIGIFRRDA